MVRDKTANLVGRDVAVPDGGGPAEEVDGLVAAAVGLQPARPQRQLVVLAAAEAGEAPSAVVEVAPDHHHRRRAAPDRVVRHRDERLGVILQKIRR